MRRREDMGDQMDKWEQVAREIVAEKAPLNWSGAAPLRGAIAAAIRQCEADTTRRCADICDAAEGQFLSPEYATNQPHSSFSERFACREVKAAILALLPKESV